MQHQQPHARQNAVAHARDDRVVDLLVRLMPPPGQHIGFSQHVLGEAMIRLLQRGRTDVHAITQ